MKKILFVCLGNICRSAAAESIMINRLKGENLEAEVDSAGTGAWHVGEQADPRMREHSLERGYEVTSISRQVATNDFFYFDYIVAMDEQNLQDLKQRCPSPDLAKKLYLSTDFCEFHKIKGVPDPYYGGSQGFEQVLDILEDLTEGLLKKLEWS